jgi:hypothetical protein
VPEEEKQRKKRRWPRALLDLVVFAALVFMLQQLLSPALRGAAIRSDIRIVSDGACDLYEAFERYYEVNRSFPNAYLSPAFELDSLEPLRRRGYYRGYVNVKLREDRIDAYDSPDDRGINQEFWLEMTLESDPEIRFLVARSNDAPLGGGEWREGAFIYRDGVLESLQP